MAKKKRYYSSESDMIANRPGSWDEMPSEVMMKEYPKNGYIRDDRYPDSRMDIDEQINANESIADRERAKNTY